MIATIAYRARSDTAPVRREAQRTFVVRFVFFIFFLSLIEGPLRKWFLPDYSELLTILRDPFVITLYAYAVANRFFIRNGMAALWVGFAIISSSVGLLQYVVLEFSMTGWMLGVRTYWLYMPLAFVIGSTFKHEDIYRFLTLCLWIAIPYSLLVAVQYNAPPFAFVNLGVGADEGAVGLAEGILRPFGLFTYTGPNVGFTVFIISVFLAFYVGQVPMRHRGIFLLVSGSAVGAMAVLTGSRSIYFLAAMIVGVTTFGMITTRPSVRNLQRVLGVLFFIGLSSGLFIFAFPDMLNAMVKRFDVAAQFEGSIWNRAFSGLFTWVESLATASFLGGGIGAGAPGVAQMLGLPPLPYGESDLQRNVNELGVFLGLALLLLRFGTAAWILWLGVRLARKGKTLALPLSGFLFFPFLAGQITHSPLSAFPVWLALGILISLQRPAKGVAE